MLHAIDSSHGSFIYKVILRAILAGLYGNLVPQTVSNFCSAVKSGLYTGTLWSKVLPGEYIQAGQQGSKRTGSVDLRSTENVMARNQEVLSSKSFRLALCLDPLAVMGAECQK